MASLMYKTFLSPSDEFIADSQTRSIFDPKKHRKYNADRYYQSDTMDVMEAMEKEPKRSDVGRRAYVDYVKALGMIQQLEPVSPEHTGETAPVPDVEVPDNLKKGAVSAAADAAEAEQLEKKRQKEEAAYKKKKAAEEIAKRGRHATWERLVQERESAVHAYRFQERLKARVEAFGKTDEETLANVGKAPIRAATMRFLVAKPEADYTTASMASAAVMILLYCNTLYQQFGGISKAEDGPFIYNGWVEMSKLDTLWAVFLVKELFFCSVPMFYVIGYTLVVAIILVLSPLIAGYYFTQVKGNPRSERAFTILTQFTLVPAIKAQLDLIASLALNLSTTWRIICIAKQLAEKKLNRSAKDFSFTLTTISNLMYDLTLVMLISDNNKNTSGVVSSLIVSLIMLMKNITAQLLLLEEICDGLADLNENRLTKFEFALLINKLSEALLDDDIQYNYVEHFYSEKHIPLMPDVDELTHKKELEEELALWIPDIPEDLAKEFGHDGLDFYHKDKYTGEAKHKDEIQKGMGRTASITKKLY